jgi:uncharacterized protein (DUF2062 family)
VWRSLKKRYRQGYVRLLRSPGAPGEVAGGMALGLFIAMMPIMGAQMPVAVVVAELIRRVSGLRLSRVAAAAGVWVTNPITAVPVYGLAILIGRPFARLFLPNPELSHPSTELPIAVTDTGEAVVPASSPFAWELGLSLVIGGVVLGVPLALVGYRLTHALVVRYQHRRAARRSRLENVRPPMAV